MIASPPWDRRRSTARRRGRTRTASRARSRTRASRARRSPRPRRGSARSTAARRCSSRPARRRARRSSSRLLSPGQTVALAEGAYYGTGVMLDELARWGIEKVEFDQTGAPPDGVDLVWLEAPSNPFLTMPDFEAAAAHPARVVCDSTAATPLNVRPLELGCDIVVHSATKYLAGHDDALVGAVVCSDAEDAARLLEFRSRTGPVPAADTAWLAPPRPARRSRCAWRARRRARSVIAERLARPSRRQTVRYPGFGGLLSFDVADADAARRVETATQLIANMTSLGGVTSRIEARARWEGDARAAGPAAALGRARGRRRAVGATSSRRSRTRDDEASSTASATRARRRRRRRRTSSRSASSRAAARTSRSRGTSSTSSTSRTRTTRARQPTRSARRRGRRASSRRRETIAEWSRAGRRPSDRRSRRPSRRFARGSSRSRPSTAASTTAGRPRRSRSARPAAPL